MKILYIAPLDSIHAHRWITFFIEKGHRVAIINSAQDTEAVKDGAEVFNIDYAVPASMIRKMIVLPGTMLKLKRWVSGIISDFEPDIIHIHWLASPLAYAISLLKCHPIICTPWGSDILLGARNNLIHRYFIKRLIRSADWFCCDAEHLSNQLVAYGARQDRTRLIYFGTNTQTFNPKAKDNRFAETLGFDSEAPLILSNRRLEPICDVETFVRAIPGVIQHIHQARFVVAGDGVQRSMLEALVLELGVGDYVRFVGWLPESETARLTASAALYVSTSLSDGGLAASTAEAMACGVPAVISDFGENREWVADGRAGRIFPLRDPGALASAIVELLKDPALCADIGAKGRDVILQKNDYFKEMEKVDAIYRRMQASG